MLMLQVVGCFFIDKKNEIHDSYLGKAENLDHVICVMENNIKLIYGIVAVDQ